MASFSSKRFSRRSSPGVKRPAAEGARSLSGRGVGGLSRPNPQSASGNRDRSVPSGYMALPKRLGARKGSGKVKATDFSAGRSANARVPAIRSIMMPRDTNPLGSIFGGHILSLLDLAATHHAIMVSPRKYVTKVIREVDFIAPVFVGDIVSFYTKTLKLGRTSIVMRVDVEAERGVGSRRAHRVTSAEVVMVAIDDHGQPIPLFDR